MTLQTFEQSISTVQLKKGLDYFNNGCISDLEEWEAGMWKAIVCGSADYHIKVKLKKGAIMECSCDCPHDTDYCKHIIAVLYAIKNTLNLEQGGKNIKKTSTVPLKGKPAKVAFTEIVNQTSENELRQFVIEYAATDHAFRNILRAHFAEKSGDDGRLIYAEIIKNAARIAGDRHGFIDYYNTGKAIKPVHALLRKADEALTKKHYAVVADIAFAVIENLHDMMNDMDDSDGDAGDCINSGFELLLKLCETEIPFDLKEHIFVDADKEAKKSKYDFAGFDEHWLNVLVHAAYNLEKELQLMQTVDKLLEKVVRSTGDNWQKEYDTKRLLVYKIALLRKMHREKEADDLRMQYIHIADIRMELIEEALSKKEYKQATQLIAAGISIAKDKGNDGTVFSYQEMLLRIAQKQADTTAIRKIARQLYDGHNMEYYRIIKKTYSSEEWPQIAEGFIDELQKPAKAFRAFRGTINGEALAVIFIEEKYWERLLKLVQNDTRLEFIENYFRYLSDKFPAELLTVYKEAIKSYAEEYTGRTHYITIRKVLMKMQKLDGGNEVVRQLVNQFTVQYKARKAMIEEMGKLKLI